MSPGARPSYAAILLVLLAGALAGALSFPSRLRLDSRADWRAVSQGLRRSAQAGALAAASGALVHFHDVRGGIRALELLVSSRTPARLTLTRDGQGVLETDVDATPRRIVLPMGPAAGDVDVALGLRDGERVLIHEIELRRGEAGGAFRWLPAVCGLAILFFLRREPRPWAVAVAVAAVAVSAACLTTAVDPIALLSLRPGVRAWIQMGAVGALFAAGAARAQSRAIGGLTLAGTALVLYMPAVRNGLVYDDFLWTRPWSLAEVGSTFVGSEDPTGVSNAYYRPLASTSHALDYAVWGFRPPLFHLTNILLVTIAGLIAWLLFRRLPVAPGAALLGALVWTAHPMSASAVAWLSQRTDLILAIFYLASLRALLARPFGRGAAALALGLGLLTFAAKEPAVMLPLASAFLLACLPPDEHRRRRVAVVRILALIVCAYVSLWVALFPEKVMTRTGTAAGWGGFDPHRLEDWVRALPALYGPVVLPTGYERWWNTRLHDWSAAYLLGVAAVVAAFLWILARPGAEPAAAADPRAGGTTVRRLALFAAVWPVLVVLPMLGLRGVDLYRGGLMIALGAGWMAVVAAHRLHARQPLLLPVASAVLGLALAPLTAATVAAWGPGGFYRGMTQASIQSMPDWLASLRPQCRDYFWAQVARDRHRAPLE
jgi:hypothetical protein